MNTKTFESAARQDDGLAPGLPSEGEMHAVGLITLSIIVVTVITGGALTYALLK